MILIVISEKTKRECSKKQKVFVMNNIIKYIKKIIRPKNLHKVSLENLGIRNIGNSIHDGCLKKKIMLDIQDLMMFF